MIVSVSSDDAAFATALVRRVLACPTAKSVGACGEILARDMLSRSGYDVRRPILNHSGDLHAVDRGTGELIRVEVKTARRGQDGKWRFTLRKNDRHGQTDHRNADVVLLLPVTRAGVVVPFVVPVAAIVHRRTAVITSNPRTYGGQFARYRQRASTIKLPSPVISIPAQLWLLGT